MRRLWRVFLIPLIAVLGAGGATRAQEVISNPGFEQVDAAGMAVDWEPVGETVTVECGEPCADHYLRLYRDEATATGETGFNRRWRPDSGEQGAMLGQVRGAVKFRYRAISARKADLCIYVIPMSDRPWEDTGERRAQFVAPEEHVGDGQWHDGALKYDFAAEPKVKWCHVSGRIIGVAGELWVDDFEYVERLGPYPRIDDLAAEEIPGADGRRFRLNATVVNAGDEAAIGAAATAAVPAGLTIVGDARTTVPALDPDAEQEVSWEIAGERRDGMRLEVASAERAVRRALVLREELSPPEIEAERFVVAPGETATVRCRLSNVGTVPIDGAAVDIDVDPALAVIGRAKRSTGSVLPGEVAALTWRVRAVRQTPQASVRITLHDVPRRESAQTALVVAPPPPTGELGGGVGLREDLAWIAAGDWRLVFPRAEFGFGVGWLQVKRDGRWETAAGMPRLARVAADAGRGEESHLVLGTPYTARASRVVSGDDGEVILHEPTSLVFGAEFKDRAGGRWTMGAGFSPWGDGVVHAQYTLECDRPGRRLLDFQGPMLWVGEGADSARSDAVFPGLEWLVGDEVSSSTLDISEEHPDRDRYHPHPNKITVPAMGVRLESGALAGLIWDPEQRWDGVHDRPSAVFSSPDRRAGRASHLIGLSLPSIPDYVRESAEAEPTGYPLDAYRELTLSAMITAQPEAPDSLAVVDRWYELNGAPEPAPLPRGDYASEVAFSMRAYLESLWVDEEQQWWTTMGAGPVLSHKGRPASFVYDLRMGVALSPDPEIAERCRERAEQMVALTGNPPTAEELGLAFGGKPDQHLIGLAGRVAGLIAAQRPDGSWRFDADRVRSGVFEGKDYHELGPDDAAEIGTCARNASEVLRYLRISGDPGARDAGLRALRFMDQFRVPRAAQVWEVPVHTPDVLAAADAVEAYLEGYRVFGDHEYLERAQYWARAGLPFIYVWGRPEFPYMLYGSIPVFGATWYRGSWFGRLVQWNGLRYSNALLKLAEYDDDFPWRTVAEGIVRSAIHQQGTDDEEVGLWPDNIGLITGDRCPWIFSPQLILKNVYALTGLHPEPETAAIYVGDGKLVRVSAAGNVQTSQERTPPGQLDCTVFEPKVGVGYVLVAGVGEPDEDTTVLADGEALERRDDLEASGEPGWRYDNHGMFVIAPPRGRERVRLALKGLRWRETRLLPDRRTDLRFDFERDAEGWVAQHEIRDMASARGRLRGRIVGGDPYLTRSNLAVAGDDCGALVISMRVTGGEMGQLYWGTSASPAFAEDKVIRFDLRADNEFHEYQFAVGDHPLWRGQEITALRIDPNNTAPGAEFEIDWIRCQ